MNIRSFLLFPMRLFWIITVVSVNILELFLFANNSPAFAIDETSTSATQLIGQPDFTTNVSRLKGYWNPESILQIGTKVLIGEACRISVYNSAPTTTYQARDYVIGSPNRNTTCVYSGPEAKSMIDPRGLAFDGTRLFTADWQFNRILIYNTLPTTNDAAANVVLGQPNMTSSTANNGGLSASSLSEPRAIDVSGGKLLVADRSNNRVLIWNTIPTTDNQAADVVLGQPNMTSSTANNGGITAHSLYQPNGVAVVNGKLYISDSGNNRVLIFNTIPTTNQQDADLVLGQPNMTSNTANNGGISSHSIKAPINVSGTADKLLVTDSGNHRVLIFNTIPSVNQADADVAVGQPDMTSGTVNNGGLSASSLNNPWDADIIDGKLYIADLINARVLGFNSVPTTNGASANFVLGQDALTRNNNSYGGYNRLASTKVVIQGGKMAVIDTNNHRVLLWNSVPSPSDTVSPDVVLGQPDITSSTANNGGASASSLYYPWTGAICGDKLVVGDYLNSRVLIWNSWPTVNQEAADIVLGQPNMTSGSANNGGVSAHSLYFPSSATCVGTKLMITDLWNHRVLIWNEFPTTNQEDADLVLGQPNMTSNTVNNGGISAHSLNRPSGAESDGTRLSVADYANNRVLIWTSFPVANQEDADLVLGQPNMTSNTVNNGGISASSLYIPYGLYSDGTRFFIVDSANHRILGWSDTPTTNGQSADFVIGQASFTSIVRNITAETLLSPTTLSVYNGNVYVGDQGNNRILIYPTGPSDGDVTVDPVIANPTVTVDLSATGVKDMLVSEDSGFSGASWEPYASTKSLTVSDGEGSKTVYAKYRDYANYEGSVLSATTVLDTSAPTGSISINGGATATNNRATTLTLAATDTISSVTHMKLSESASFTGASWESYATSKSFTVSTGDGTKTVYAKFKDAAGNESTAYTDTITLDTMKPTINITNLGLISNVLYKSSLYYYFTSRTPYIQGQTEANSVVHFKYDKNDYTSTANSFGWYGLSILTLPLGYSQLTYYAIDTAGNKSSERTLELMIQTESADTTSEGPTGTVKITPTAPTGEEPIQIELFTVAVQDANANALINTPVIINGQRYVTDSKGNIYIEQKPTSDMTIKVEINEQLVDGTVEGDKIVVATLDTLGKNKRSWWVAIVAILTASVGLLLIKRRANTQAKPM
ncbi:hypothetical protein COY54_00935 [Candidatus Falkowbacteria bacterium CG_4_10_14_0_8_um_filter_41_36]|uniref:Bacterial Ig-like domain-containing protein n=1 Tax=Candidatus Falkowbacteria bacterium CG_4_10_14_0_8_um_filter_41_36 TaxID=1974556 RepID=A0A2M7RY16_9BACT|nr:MAG: hypothetical protein COY54_00935 [Candidatus Falkowbacteria bacterium CG_4_10_14_0_8_um_filter_41_36]